MFALLKTFSWQELLHHPWRNGAAVVAVMLGVALAFSVALINTSALGEFAQAVRSVNGEPDLELRAGSGFLDEMVYARVASERQVAAASPVLELATSALARDGKRFALRIVGIDALQVAQVAPGLLPQPGPGADRMAIFDPESIFLNAVALQALAPHGQVPAQLQVQDALRWRTVHIAGSVTASGGPLAVMDIGALQDLFGRGGQLSRIDLRLLAGTDRDAFARVLMADQGWGPNLRLTPPADGLQRIGNVSRAYRVNLTVLALVALFTGSFLVFSVLALSVANRAQQFALLDVLGLGARARLQLVLAEALVLGSVGSAAGIALGSALAWLALRLLGGDLGGGYFPGVTPTLQWDGTSAAMYGLLGLAAALVGGWLPARAAQRLPAAQTLKGAGAPAMGAGSARLAPWLLAASALLCLAPPVWGIALAAYAAIGLLLVGGISLLPAVMALVFDRLAPLASGRVLPMLAMERARRVGGGAAVTISGVVAALSLAVALTVMVASFRASVDRWLDVVLPADLFLRTASGASGNETAYFPASFVLALQQLPGVQLVASLRSMPLSFDPGRPAVALLSRSLGEVERSLPLVGSTVAAPRGTIAIYVSEAMVDLYGARLGAPFKPLSDVLLADRPMVSPQDHNAVFFVAGVWRDYARQFGSIAIAKIDFERITGDTRASDVSLWLAPGSDNATVQQRVRDLAAQQGGTALVDIATAGEIRSLSLRIFDRSFAVTYWLQAVAIAIGLFGVAANFSAQVLSRRKEFGLLAHLGLTRRQILRLVAAEGLAWTSIGAAAGLLLGLAVSAVLVHVVNPQSFHWTMDLLVPWWRLLTLCAATVIASTATAWLAARAAAGAEAVLAVKEDW